MKRVSAELEAMFGQGGPEEEELIVQGVRFAFRVHQVKNVTVSDYYYMKCNVCGNFRVNVPDSDGMLNLFVVFSVCRRFRC